VAPDLKAGRLVMPFDFKMSSDAAYYLVYPLEAIRRRKIKAFRDWIMSLAEARQTANVA
jgi:LysR family transcriptional regulator, glycine cleavage system transcriptional activator